MGVTDFDEIKSKRKLVPNFASARFRQSRGETLTDLAFFLATRAYKVVGVRCVYDTAGTDASAVNVQVTKDTGTNAPGAGTDLLTNNTNAGFNLKATANTPQTGTLVTTAGATTMAAGDRLSLDFAGTLTALAGLVVEVDLEVLATA
jgi:hypothetical protein